MATVKDRPGLLAYLDSRMAGGHSGAWPEFQFWCPFCLTKRGSEAATRKLRINVAKGKGMCYRCQTGFLSLASFFRALSGGKELTVVEQDLIAGDAAFLSSAATLKDELLVRFFATERPPHLRPVPLPREYVPLAGNGNNVVCRPAFTYLHRARGFTAGLAEFVARHSVGYCLTGEYANRLVFPVDQGGRRVYFTTRYCGDHLLKGKNPRNAQGAFTREACLLNYDGCVGAPVVFVVEGPLSMAAFRTPVAMMGKSMSDAQLALLGTLADRGTGEFVLATDPDASKEAAGVFRRMKGALPKVSYLRLEGGDPFDLRASIQPFVDDRRESVGLSDALRSMRVTISRPKMVRA